jgi:hypothetical protein
MSAAEVAILILWLLVSGLAVVVQFLWRRVAGLERALESTLNVDRMAREQEQVVIRTRQLMDEIVERAARLDQAKQRLNP